MQYSELVAHLAVGLGEPISEFSEIYRRIREGAERITADDAKQVRAVAKDIDRNFNWDANSLKKAFRAKTGHHGGIEMDASSLGFFLTAYLLDVVPRREVAIQTLRMTFAGFAGDAGGAKVCPVTGQFFFGGAFKALLSDRSMFARATRIRVSNDLGLAVIDFKDEPESSYFALRGFRGLKPSYRESTLLLTKAGFLFDLVNGSEATAKVLARRPEMARENAKWSEHDRTKFVNARGETK